MTVPSVHKAAEAAQMRSEERVLKVVVPLALVGAIIGFALVIRGNVANSDALGKLGIKVMFGSIGAGGLIGLIAMQVFGQRAYSRVLDRSSRSKML